MAQDNKNLEGIARPPVKPPVPGSVLSEVEPVGRLPLTLYEDAEFMAPLLIYEDPLMAVGLTRDLKMLHLMPISGETFKTEQGKPFELNEDMEISWFGKADLYPWKLSAENYGDVGTGPPVGKVDFVRQAMEKSGIPIPWERETIFISGGNLGDPEKRYETRAHEIRHFAFKELRKRFWLGLVKRLEGLDPHSSEEDMVKVQGIIYPFGTDNPQPPFPFPGTFSGTNKDFGEHGIIYLYDWLTNDARLRELAESYLKNVHSQDLKSILINLSPGFPARKQIDALNELSNQLLEEQGRPQRPPMDISQIVRARMQELPPEDREEVNRRLGREGSTDVEEQSSPTDPGAGMVGN